MQFVVTSRSEIWATSNGNLYLECETDRGTVAFWGKTVNTRNIDSVESKAPPFSVSCEVIDGRWPQHRYWVMESKRLSFGSLTELKRDGRIPRKTAALMIAVTEVRNASEHPGEQPTPSESLAARSAWEAVSEWAMSQGVDPNSL